MSAEELGKSIHETIESGSSVMMVHIDGEFRHVTKEEFYERVFGAMTERQRIFLKMLEADFSSLEEKISAVCCDRSRNKISGYGIKEIILDELAEEPEAVPNKPNIKTNKRSKGKGHPLPFYLGSKRRY
ncbi:hypothetical protein REXELLA_42 [Erwinia phage vB_EamP_Rexella]|uniref:Uncharacterized protein n=1 Tax=Erwinia phage vB_EamP_Rexella TaxID=1852642 RepID=A0A191ZD04_9CAUD|nr:hypothetical protein REXELLA_42 [Erwinia phage vB_EamP_Rexella]